MFASVIVSAWNRMELLSQCLERLIERTHYPYELIVHDDGSDPVVQQWLMERLNQGLISTLILNPAGHNRGHGTAVNRAANVAEGDYIVKLNGDETFVDGWLARGIEVMERYPQIKLLHLAHYYKGAKRETPIEEIQWDLDPYTLHKLEGARVVWVGPGCAFMVRRGTWQHMGPWMNHYNPRFTEDIEYRMRLCPMMRLLNRAPKDLEQHWRLYRDSPWLGVVDPPVVSYHPGHGLCSIGRSRETLKQGPHLLGDEDGN